MTNKFICSPGAQTIKKYLLQKHIRLWGMLTSTGFWLCAGTVLGCLGRYWWLTDLFSHFRVQYAIGLFLLSALFFINRRIITAILFLAFSLSNMCIIVPLYMGGTGKEEKSENTFRAVLINVNTQNTNTGRVCKYILEVNPDILVLEEINSRWVEALKTIESSYPYSLSQPREDNFGIGLFSKWPLANEQVTYIGKAGVPSITATVRVNRNNDINIIATHPLPPVGTTYSQLRNEQLQLIPEYVSSDTPVILFGDLNTTPWNYFFKRLVKQSGLIDSSRGKGIQPTWPSTNPLFWIPIDHCLHSPSIHVLSRKIGPNVSSDHFPLVVDFLVLQE